MDRWTGGPVDWWTGVPVDRWTSGPVDQWTSGPVDRWTGGPVDQWTGGPVDQWTGGPGPVDQVQFLKKIKCSRGAPPYRPAPREHLIFFESLRTGQVQLKKINVHAAPRRTVPPPYRPAPR